MVVGCTGRGVLGQIFEAVLGGRGVRPISYTHCQSSLAFREHEQVEVGDAPVSGCTPLGSPRGQAFVVSLVHGVFGRVDGVERGSGREVKGTQEKLKVTITTGLGRNVNLSGCISGQ